MLGRSSTGEVPGVASGTVIVSNAAATAGENEDVLETAVRDHARMVYRIAYSVLHNHHDAEDATQETFIRVLRYRRKLEGVTDQKTWLARIAWRVATDRRRKAAEITIDVHDVAVRELRSSLARADQAAISAESVAWLGRLIAGLPRELRDAITLQTVQDLSTPEVAAILGVSEAAVRSRVFRARQLLKEKLGALLGKRHGTTEL